METHHISLSKYVAALSLAGLLFVLGLIAGTYMNSFKMNDITSMQKELEIQLTQMDLEDKLAETLCSNPVILDEKLNELGTKLSYLEEDYSKDDPRIIDLKKPYTLLELRHYLRTKKMNDECNTNYIPILFFYSNSPEFKSESERQGFVLDYFRNKNETVKVYSFDSDIDLEIIQTLKKMYQIEAIPSFVINDGLYVGFHDKEELEKVLV